MPAQVKHPSLPSNKDHAAYMRAWRKLPRMAERAARKALPGSQPRIWLPQPASRGLPQMSRPLRGKSHGIHGYEAGAI